MHCGQNTEFLNVKLVVHKWNLRLLKVNTAKIRSNCKQPWTKFDPDLLREYSLARISVRRLVLDRVISNMEITSQCRYITPHRPKSVHLVRISEFFKTGCVPFINIFWKFQTGNNSYQRLFNVKANLSESHYINRSGKINDTLSDSKLKQAMDCYRFPSN